MDKKFFFLKRLVFIGTSVYYIATKTVYMKYFLPLAFVLLCACADNSNKTDNEKAESETKIEIKTDSGEVKINSDGISIQSSEGGKDTVGIRINGEDGIKIEGKDGKVELKTDGGGKIKIEKKGTEIDIKIKEN